MTAKARKLLERMRASKANWKANDLKRLVTSFGFIVRNGANHDIFIHPKYRSLRGTIPRHRVVDKAYVEDAIKKVDALLALEAEEQDGDESKD